MQVNITAVGPDNRCLADPIIHHVTAAGANIHEIQMYDRDEEKVFAMFLRLKWPGDKESLPDLRDDMRHLGEQKGLSIRVWSRDERPRCVARARRSAPTTGSRPRRCVSTSARPRCWRSCVPASASARSGC